MTSQHSFVAERYEPRARAYLASAVHSAGADLDQVEALLRSCATPPRVLDLGCGGGHASYRAAPHAAAVTACDITIGMLAVVHAEAAARGLTNITTVRAAAEGLPFADAAFDIVLCRFSAHHWQDLAAGLAESRRVLAPGGAMALIDTVAPSDRTLDSVLQAVELLRDATHVRNDTADELVGLLAAADFATQSVTPRRLRLEFAAWAARTGASALHQQAIRSLQAAVPEQVRSYFEIGQDGSFTIDVATIIAMAV